MNFNLVFTRRTWYLLLIIAAALSMSAGFSALIGEDLSTFTLASFAITGLAILFLAAEKENSLKLRNSYFQSFLLWMLGYVMGGVFGLIGAGLAWPMLLYTEQKRGADIGQQLRLVIFAEAAYAIFWISASAGVESVYLFVNIFALCKALARGWAAFTLSRAEKNAQQ